MVPPDLRTSATARPPRDDVVGAAARAVVASSSLETLSRPFLDVLHSLTGLESTYLTEIRPERDDQVVRYADNRGALRIDEGVSVDWQQSLCRRALETQTYATADAATVFPGPVQRDLGITSFVSVPVLRSDDVVMGTLCGASSRPVPVAVGVVEVMTMLSRLIADQWERDRRHAAALERADEAEQRLLSRATFLAEAEHKLKSPLTVIRGWSELLADDWTVMADDERREAVSILQKASDEATRQVERLLDEARGEVLSLQLVAEPVEVSAVVTEVARQLSGAATTKHRVASEEVVPSMVLGDRAAVWQVVWHLAENALKYSPAGGRIDLGCAPTDDGRVEITVTDEGLGVPTDVDLFAPFTRGPAATRSSIKGTGLGLHIVANLVKAMSGSVSAETRPERGSTFRVLLPSAAGPAPRSPEVRKQAYPSGS